MMNVSRGFRLLLLYMSRCLVVGAVHVLPVLTTDDYSDFLQPGTTSLLYFSSAGLSGNVIFLEELQKSSPILQDYGISVAKVICGEEAALQFCAEDNAYLFSNLQSHGALKPRNVIENQTSVSYTEPGSGSGWTDKVRLRRSCSVNTRRGRHRKKMGGAGPGPQGPSNRTAAGPPLVQGIVPTEVKVVLLVISCQEGGHHFSDLGKRQALSLC
ncbi:unnamed protein product [Ranitomeya imitator]|uniref:TXNDC16 N-terminal domain-containing protein n=1 Tax=Ranitomeya imitator TaxID=111125 RepID=A0ABN9L207_9NEOB|nr:unnamed protein product [Ranitomeya imitator]